MSLKITVEVDGQTEQQIAPVVAPFIARLAMRHPEWTQVDKRGRSPGQVQVRDFHHDNPALLQQHIQQLTAQNKLLQQQVSQNQRLLAGAAPPKVLPPGAVAQQAVTDSTVATSGHKEEQSLAPMLPAQYRVGRSAMVLPRLRRSLGRTPMRLWRSFIWLVTNEWLLLFLLLCGGTYGVLTIAPWISNQLWPPPEFVDSAKEGPGGTAEPEPTDGGVKEGAEAYECRFSSRRDDTCYPSTTRATHQQSR